MSVGAGVACGPVGDESGYVAGLTSTETVVAESTLSGSPPEVTAGV